MVVIINESGSVYDDEKNIHARDYMNPETGEMLGSDEHNTDRISEYLQRCSVNYSDDSEKNKSLNFDDINP